MTFALYRELASAKASQTLQTNFPQLSYTHPPSSRLVSDQVTLAVAAHTIRSESLPSEPRLMQTKVSANTGETEWTPSVSPLGNETDITPPTASPESLPSATEFNDTQTKPPETSYSDLNPLGATLSPDSPTQNLITVNTYPSSTSDQKSLDPLHDNLVALTIPSKQVDLGIERLPSISTGSDNSPSDGSNGHLEITEFSQPFLVRTSDEDGVQPGHSSHTQMEGQTAAPQGETTQGAYAPQSPTTLVIISPFSSSTAADSVSSSPSIGASLDGSGVSRRPSRQSLAVIFGSILGSKGMPSIAHVTVAKKANVQN
ncbi:uncharacterized protein N7515_004643 [Penicillium bovifimosum]|uniref:Uncharacterized protein n=1 Tax=Penicillium bovifimosum TaxID=126998 RepID=A0A9W9H0U6_9EURO|nr:uncharacterized protein N7515_004643 [Penicillium bovifimosum]KAJ5135365.1 hypothetical protein N7515_004643 [Penicillium bovifimosum]